MKQYRITALFLALLLTLSACGGGTEPPDSSSSAPSSASASREEDPPPEPIPFTLAYYPEYSLHPALAVNRANLTLAPLLYEGLFTVDSSFQAQNVLCQSYTVSEDSLVWTFTLRSGITFSDGAPLTGQAVADALNLARGPGGNYRERLSILSAVTVPEEDPSQVVITLRRSNGSLPLLLDIPIALGDGDRPAGTGPYVFSEDQTALTARADWWQRDKALPAQRIALREVDSSDDLLYAFDAGEISLVDVDLMATNAVGYGGNYQTWDYPTTDLLYLGFNTQKGAFRSEAARRAVSLAVDRDTIATTVYANHAISTLLPVHPSSGLYRPVDEPLTYNPEGLSAQVEALRLTDSSLVFLVNSENVPKTSTAQLIAYQLETAGFAVELRQLPFDEFTAALKAGNFDLYLGETVLTADFNLFPLLSSAGELNYGGWEAEGGEILLLDMQGAFDDADKTDAAYRLSVLLDEQSPIVPILFKNGSVLTQWGRLSGLNPVRGNVFYQIENWTVK